MNEKILLSEQEETELIRRYAKIESDIITHEKCAIGAGYTTCMDVSFHAKELLEGPLAREVQALGQVKPHVHPQISTLREFIETFLYYFSQGANAERVCVSFKPP